MCVVGVVIALPLLKYGCYVKNFTLHIRAINLSVVMESQKLYLVRFLDGLTKLTNFHFSGVHMRGCFRSVSDGRI